ncbi:MAG TPA: metallophosphoesterase [Syntrophomonadaceae bacterium]|nr:metallophosphoesterase [Syntrophomonadaceae bacterium]
MRIWSVAPFILFVVIFYTGKRGQQAFARYIPPSYIKVYWAVYLLFACSFLLGRGLAFGNQFLNEILIWCGAYSLGFLFYAFFILILIDILRLVDRWLGIIPDLIKQSPAKIGMMVVFLLVGLLAYGSWNARHPVFTSYQINIPKYTTGSQQLHVIMISDLHLGEIVNNGRLTEIVAQINQRNPDIILVGGDLIDGDLGPFVKQNMGSTLRQLKPRLGTYMVLGNHDGHGKEVLPYFQAAGITVLSDQYQLIDNSFYLVGEDYGGHQSPGSSQSILADIMVGINKALPIVLLKHSPTDLEDARVNGVDLQLSGHTHQGQLFPNNLITQRMYEIDWGYLRKGDLQVIVSTGFGTWGPPIRIGNTPEVVDLVMNFKS